MHLLKEVFGMIIIPPAVEAELAEVPGQLDFILEMQFLEIRSPEDSTTITNYKSMLDDGEAEAITLAIELKADFVIMDEWKGRKIAQKAGLNVIGLIGILLVP